MERQYFFRCRYCEGTDAHAVRNGVRDRKMEFGSRRLTLLLTRMFFACVCFPATMDCRLRGLCVRPALSGRRVGPVNIVSARVLSRRVCVV